MRAICLCATLFGGLAGCAGDAERNRELALERRNEEQEISDESIFDLLRNRSVEVQNFRLASRLIDPAHHRYCWLWKAAAESGHSPAESASGM